MKLIGEYQLHDNGVTIEGRINDSHIHEVRQLFSGFGTVHMYKGDVDQTGMVYHVPHPMYRPYIMRHIPEICTPEREMGFVDLAPLQHRDVYYGDASVFANNMGIIYREGDGRSVMDNRRIHQYRSRLRPRMRLLTNSAWVWNANERGEFKIDIYGLANRHMMTVLIANATKLAKYIDTVLVRALDTPDKFTPEHIQGSLIY
jgi:hypothetical protein